MINKFLTKKIFKTPSQVALPYILTRKRIYIMPTRYGFLFLLVLSGMLMGSVNYENNVGFLLTFLLGGMAFISIFHTYKNMAGIQILSSGSTPAFAGEKTIFYFNVKPGYSASAAVVFHLETKDEILTDIFLNKDIKIEVSAKQRGILKPGLLKIYSSYPLGLFYAWSNLNLDLKAIVYPRPVSGPVLSSELGSSEDHDQGMSIISGTDDFEGLKIYQPGDSLQHISWKAYSKGQGLMTKSFIAQQGRSIFLDWDSLKEKDAEQKLSRLCDMVLKSDRLKINYGLKLPGKIIESGSGNAHKHNCLRELALFGIPKQEL
ncbi:DUF58 [Desulfonema limicola]|uniref:DUF58 n=1 Tax=Desulfonema limicola TaxID=45656 RepID=A0A975B3M5_9BACT|nr:DUF58 domain-containing protein [Desulfonema limicola]QTA78166.1 DUF58 [Desulfonema limicola]